MYDIREITTLAEAEQVWKALTDNETIFDNWDFRYTFYKYFNYPIHFWVAYFEDKPVSLVPLQYDERKGFLNAFGGNYMDHNKIFTMKGHENVIPKLFDQVKEETKFIDIIGEDPFITSLPLEDYSYFVTLVNYSSAEDYIRKALAKKRRNELLKYFRDFEVNYTVNFSKSDPDNKLLSKLEELNVNTFEDSWFKDPYMPEIFRDLFNSMDAEIATISNGEDILAVSLSLIYNGTYFYLMTGSKNREVNNIGKYLNYINLQRAIDLKLNIFDAGLGDCNWKILWHMETMPQYQFVVDKR